MIGVLVEETDGVTRIIGTEFGAGLGSILSNPELVCGEILQVSGSVSKYGFLLFIEAYGIAWQHRVATTKKCMVEMRMVAFRTLDLRVWVRSRFIHNLSLG